MLALGLAALVAAPAVQAQDAPKAKLQAYAMVGKKATRLPVLNATGKNKFIYLQGDQQMQLDVSKCDMFRFITPADFATAVNDYRAADIEGARKKLGAVKSKYAEYVGLPGNPSSEAALLELDCALRQLDWAGAKALADGFSHPEYMTEEQQASIAVAKVLGNISDAPGSLNTQKEAVASLLKGEVGKKLSLKDYGRLRYALARAYEAEVPAEQLAGTVTEAQAADLIKAVDNYCQAALSTHGSEMEIPLDAMQRALVLLWAQPGVKEYAAGGAMDAARWSAAPVNFKDAATLAFLLKKVYTDDDGAALAKKALVDEVAALYVAPEKKADAAAE